MFIDYLFLIALWVGGFSVGFMVHGKSFHKVGTPSASHNTGIPKLPTWEETYAWAMGSHGIPDLDQGKYAILRGCYDFIVGNFGRVPEAISQNYGR